MVLSPRTPPDLQDSKMVQWCLLQNKCVILFYLEALGNHNKRAHCWWRNRFREKPKLQRKLQRQCQWHNHDNTRLVDEMNSEIIQNCSKGFQSSIQVCFFLGSKQSLVQIMPSLTPVWDWVLQDREGEGIWSQRQPEFSQVSLGATWVKESKQNPNIYFCTCSGHPSADKHKCSAVCGDKPHLTWR